MMLARISHQISTAAADPGMSTSLRSVGLLDILSSMPAGPCVALAGKLPDAPCIHARLRRLATKPGEKCGLREHHRDMRPVRHGAHLMHLTPVVKN